MRAPILAVTILLFAAAARADTLLTIKLRLETTPPTPAAVPTAAEMRLWVGDHRLREDNPQFSVIRRFDRGKLYFVDHLAKEYAEVDLPANPAKLGEHQPAESTAAGDAAKERSPRPKTQMTVTLTDEVRRIGSWNARKVVVVTHDPLADTSGVKWMSTEVGVDEGTLNRWQASAVILPPGSQDSEWLESQRQLNEIPGYPVLEETLSTGGPGKTEYRWYKELLSAESKEPPAGIYDPPAGYSKVEVGKIDMTHTGAPANR